MEAAGVPIYSFTVIEGPDLGRVFDLQPGTTMLGRLDSATAGDSSQTQRWTLIDKTVSRTHIELTLDAEGKVELTHRSATNETFVNGQSVSIEILESGQIIQLGRTKMIVQQRESAPELPETDSGSLRSGTIDRQLGSPDFDEALKEARGLGPQRPTEVNLEAGLTFHIPKSKDVDVVVDLMKDYALESGVVFSDKFARRAVETLRTVASAGRVWMIRLNSESIGYLVMTFGFDLPSGEREALLDGLFLKESFRAQGMGIKSVDFAKYQARKHGATLFKMRPRASDDLAKSFCAKCGLEEQSTSVWA